MRVWHASPFVVECPDVSHSRDNLDFGRGFYVTTIKNQAVSYAQRFIRRGQRAYLNEYELNEVDLLDFRVLSFGSYDEEWLNFVMACRRGADDSAWDLVSGGIANDRVFATVDLYFAGMMSREDALGRLAYEKPNDQLCIRTQKALDELLSFVSAEEVL